MAETTKKEDLICKACAVKEIGGGQYNCPIHGHKYITWKCHKCCREALYLCGTAYFCEYHHDQVGEPSYDCGGVDCPLGVKHPPISDNPKKNMFPLGCSLCRVKTDREYHGMKMRQAVEEVTFDEEETKDAYVDNSDLYVKYNPLNDYFGGTDRQKELDRIQKAREVAHAKVLKENEKKRQKQE